MQRYDNKFKIQNSKIKKNARSPFSCLVSIRGFCKVLVLVLQYQTGVEQKFFCIILRTFLHSFANFFAVII